MLDKLAFICYDYYMVEGNTYEQKRLANSVYRWVNRLLGYDSKPSNAMRTIEAIKIIERAGMTVVWSNKAGAWLVTLFEGCVEKMTRREMVEFAKDLLYVEK